MARPGIMVYFDLRQPLQFLSTADKGLLFEALLDYGEFGILPDFSENGMLAMAWAFLQPKLDRDSDNYDNAVLQRKYAAYCKQCKSVNKEPMPFSTWKKTADNEEQRPLTTVNGQHPTTTISTTASTTSTPTTTTTAAGKGEGAGGGEAEVQFDDLKKARIAQLMGSK